jgi:hypothetical protein
VKPFQAGLEYLGELQGFGTTATRIEFNLPPIGGQKTTGYLDELEYTNHFGFKGKGFFEATLPILGKITAEVAMNRGKLNAATVTFLNAAFPQSDPIITGNGQGKIDFDDYNRFLEANLSGDFDLSIRDDDGKTPPTRLTGGAFFKGGKYGAGLKLHDDLKINDYIKLNAFSIDVGPDGAMPALSSRRSRANSPR